eukprot:COSAG02_NODE_643_length_19037_cov_9.951632_8_plen_1392_part_00
MFSARVSLYDRGTKSIFGRTWESAPLAWPHLDEPKRKADLEIAQTVALHTTVVGPSCQIVVEIVRGEVSVGWGVAPLFPPHGAGKLRDTFGPEVEVPMFAGTPRYLLFDDQPPAEHALPDCTLRLRVRTLTAMAQFQKFLRENEIVGISDGLPGLGGSLSAPTVKPTCTIKLSDLAFAIPGVPDSIDVRTSTDISKQDFDAAMMKYLKAVTPPDVWANSKGVTKARALVGVHNGHCYIAPRVSVALTKKEGLAGGYSLVADEPAELTDVPLDAGIAVIISLQMTLDTPSAGASAAATTLLIGWITTCPCDAGVTPPSTSECVGPLSRGPRPAPDGCLAVSWGDLEVEEEVRFLAAGSACWLLSILPRSDASPPLSSQVTNNNINVQFTLVGDVPPPPAENAVANAAPVSASAGTEDATDDMTAAMKAKVVEQQTQIAQLQKKLAAEEERAKSAASQPLKPVQPPGDASLAELASKPAADEAAPEPAAEPAKENIVPKTERSTSLSGAPWVGGDISDAQVEVVRLSAQIRAKAEAEEDLLQQLSKLEATKEQLAHDYQEQERSLKIAEATAAGIPREIAKMTEPNTAEELRTQMMKIVDAEIGGGEFEVSPAEPVSRTARAELYNAGVPEIVDTEHAGGGPAQSGRISAPVDLSLEESDTLQDNELVFQCMGFTPTSDWTAKNVYFVVQFYHFPPAVTETVAMQPIEDESGDATHIFVKTNVAAASPDEAEAANAKGVKVSFTVKGGQLRGETAVAESRRLASYLCTGALHIEMWDADALLPIGSLKAQLAGLLRQGQASVESTMQLDVRSERLPGGGGGVTTGTLQLAVANIGRMAMDAAAELGKRVREDDNITTGHLVSGVVANATAEGRMRYRARASPFVSDASSADAGGKGQGVEPGKVVSDEERKITRLHKLTAARAARNKDAGKETGEEIDIERVERMQEMNIERERTRQLRIAKSLKESLTRTLRLQTRFGEASFFEYVFQNPYSTNLNVTLEFDDEELAIVTDVDEWAYFKKKHGLSSPLERNFMAAGGREVYLGARETVYIPFTLRSEQSGRVPQPVEGDVVDAMPEGVPGFAVSASAAKPRQFTLTVRGPPIANAEGETTEQVLSVLKLDVVPQPFVVDARLHFHAAQEEQMAVRIPVAPHMCPAWRAPGQMPGSSWYVHCTEPNAVVEITKTGIQTSSGSSGARPGPDVHLRYKPGKAPTASIFYLVLYRDRLRSSPAGVWQIVVHSLDMHELRATMGQSTSKILTLSGPKEDRKREGLRCCSSQPTVLKILPVRVREHFSGSIFEICSTNAAAAAWSQEGGTMSLEPDQRAEINVALQPMVTGNSSWLVSVVDPAVPSAERLLRRLLVTAAVPNPNVARTYEAALVRTTLFYKSAHCKVY